MPMGARTVRISQMRHASHEEDENHELVTVNPKLQPRKRGRTKVYFSNASRDEVVDYLEDEYGEEDHESVNQRLEFKERHQMPAGYDFRGARLQSCIKLPPLD